MQFRKLDLHPSLLAGIEKMGLKELTQIQEDCLEPALEKRHIAGVAQTGTGKTIAFLMPILHHIFSGNLKRSRNPKNPAALIITPTRELCLQIAEEAQKLCSEKTPRVEICPVYGGESYQRQEAKLSKSPQLIAATPGRLIDYIQQNKIIMRDLSFLVLDEADRMFDMGFIRDIHFIMRRVPREIQIMLFSATLSRSVLRLARDFMPNMAEVRVKSESVAVDKIDQRLIHLGASEKNAYLVNQILEAKEPRVIVFTNFRHRVENISRLLQDYSIPSVRISSLLSQNKRSALLKDFKENKFSTLVATDIASRGLDIDELSHIFNYDLPQDAEAYVHRIGRTARAGNSGISISYCSEKDYENLPRIERYLGKKIPVEAVKNEWLKLPKRPQSSRPSSEPRRPRRPPPRSSKEDGRPIHRKRRHREEGADRNRRS